MAGRELPRRLHDGDAGGGVQLENEEGWKERMEQEKTLLMMNLLVGDDEI